MVNVEYKYLQIAGPSFDSTATSLAAQGWTLFSAQVLETSGLICTFFQRVTKPPTSVPAPVPATERLQRAAEKVMEDFGLPEENGGYPCTCSGCSVLRDLHVALSDLKG